MRRKTKILSVLLATLLLLSCFTVGISATEAPSATKAPGAVLFEEDFDEPLMKKLGWAQDTTGYTGTTYGLNLVEDWGTEGNHALRLTEQLSNWCGVQLLSADKLAGMTKYSIAADLQYENAATFAFRFGDESNNGDCFGISWDTMLWNATTAQNNNGAATVQNCDRIGKNKALAMRVEIDITVGTAVAYVNDEKVTERSDATKAVGGIYLMLRGLDGYMDNIVVKNTETGAVIYSEDFETVTDDIYTANDSEYNDQGKDTTTVVPKNGVLALERPNEGGYSEWGNLREIVPVSAVSGVDKYVISFDLNVKQASGSWTYAVWMAWGAGGNAKRNLVRFCSDASGDVIKTFATGVVAGDQKLYDSAYASSVNRDLRVSIEVDATAKTFTFYVNGVQGGSFSNANFVNGGFSIGVAYKTVATVDNLCVTAGEVTDLAQVRYVGVQGSAVADGKYSVRFVGTLGDGLKLEDYTEVGFRITAAWGESDTKTFDTACKTVYNKLIGKADGVTKEYTAETFGAKYLFALSVSGIPTDAGAVTFTVTPYYATTGGTVEGMSYTVVYTAGAFTSQTIAS